MKLLTREITSKIPMLYSQEDKGSEAEIMVKFFTPWSDWTWYATEASGVSHDADGEIRYSSLKGVHLSLFDDVLFFGLVDGFEKELGYFTLNELESLKGPMGLRIERDMHYSGHRISEVN